MAGFRMMSLKDIWGVAPILASSFHVQEEPFADVAVIRVFRIAFILSNMGMAFSGSWLPR
jgi:hypothetical protein